MQPQRLGLAGVGEVVEVERFVDAVHAGIGVTQCGHQHRRAGESVLELRDHRDRAALADEVRRHTVRALERGERRVGDGPLERDRRRLTRVTGGDLDVRTPRGVALEVAGQRLEGPFGVASGGYPQADLGARLGREGVRGLRDRRGVERDHRHRRTGPQSLDGGSVAEVIHAVQDPGLGAQPIFWVLQIRPRTTGQTLDGDVARLVVQGGEQPAQRGEGIRCDAAELPRVQRMVQGSDLHDAIGQTAQGGGEGGLTDVPVARIGDDEDVRVEQVAVLGQHGGQRGGAHLFLAFAEQRDPHRRLAVEGLQCREVTGDAGFVVGDAAAEPAAVTLADLERRIGPERLVTGGLDVVVGVQANGRLALGGGKTTDDGGLTALGDDLHVRAVQLAQLIRHPFRTTRHVLGALGVGADRRDRHVLGQLLQRAGDVFLHAAQEVGHRLIVSGWVRCVCLSCHGLHDIAPRTSNVGACSSPTFASYPPSSPPSP